MTIRTSARWLLLSWTVALASLGAAEPGSDFPGSAPLSLTCPSADGHPLPEGEGRENTVNSVTPARDDAWRANINEQLEASITRLLTGERMQPGKVVGPTRGEGAFVPNFESKVATPGGSEKRGPQTLVALLLQEHGLPPSLTSVVAVESAFNPLAISPKGARGLWQMMPGTARRYGLKVESDEDERTNPLKSTNAAAAYIKDLYSQFRDWPLVLAAYNAGEDRVARAMARTGARDFWTLKRHGALPEETLQYVPAVLTKLQGPLTTPQFQVSISENQAGMNGSENGRMAYASPAVK